MLEPGVLTALPGEAQQMLPLGLADLVEVAEIPNIPQVDPRAPVSSRVIFVAETISACPTSSAVLP